MTTPRDASLDPRDIRAASDATRGLSNSIRSTILPVLGLSAALALLNGSLFEATLGGRLLSSSTYRLNSALHDLFNLLARGVAPIIRRISDALADLVRWFLELDEELQKQIIQWTLWILAGLVAAALLRAIIGAVLLVARFIAAGFRIAILVVTRFSRVLRAILGFFQDVFQVGIRAAIRVVIQTIQAWFASLQRIGVLVAELRGLWIQLVETFRAFIYYIRSFSLPGWITTLRNHLSAILGYLRQIAPILSGLGLGGVAAAAGGAAPVAAGAGAGAAGAGVGLLAERIARALQIDPQIITGSPLAYGGPIGLPPIPYGPSQGIRDITVQVTGNLIGSDAADVVAELWRTASRRGAFE